MNGRKISFRSLLGLSSKTFTFDCITKAISMPAQYTGNVVTIRSEDKELLSVNAWSRGWSLFEVRLKLEGVKITEVSSARESVDPERLSKMQKKMKKVCWWIMSVCIVFIILVLVISRT